MAGLKITTFGNADLNVDYIFTWQHNLGTEQVVPLWIDSEGSVRNTPEAFTIVDADTVTLSVGGVITGEHSLIVMYDNIVALQGRKLFALSEVTDPATDMRVAIGKDGTLSVNITLADLIQFVTDNSEMLTISKINSFSATDKTSLRDALQVYSQAIINTNFSRKYTSTVNGALQTDNLTPYAPTSIYHPATVKHVQFGGSRSAGTINDTGRENPVGNVTTYYHTVRSTIVKINILIETTVFTPGVWGTELRTVGYTNLIPQSTVYGSGFSQTSSVDETCPYVIDGANTSTPGRIRISPYSPIPWTINDVYFLSTKDVLNHTYGFN
jgi:hypothetical protein